MLLKRYVCDDSHLLGVHASLLQLNQTLEDMRKEIKEALSSSGTNEIGSLGVVCW